MSLKAARLAGRERETLAFLARAPYENVFITYLILFNASPATLEKIHIALDDDDAINGVAYFGRQVVVAGNAEAAEAFSQVARSMRGERMIIGRRDTVVAYWEHVREWHAAPRRVRERQPVMLLERPTLKPYHREVTVRRARIEEWSLVADASAQMTRQELEYDPRERWPQFTANVQQMIERGLWWVGDSLGRLCFFCNVGPWSAQTLQLQGIWTPPELRGKGFAAAAMSAICKRLLETSPTISLYVNDFNTPAINLYERIGFTTVSEFQTVLF